jgi:hypothetical protein
VATGTVTDAEGELVTSGVTALRYLPWRTLCVVGEDGVEKDYRIAVRQLTLDSYVANYAQGATVWKNSGAAELTDSGQSLGSSNSAGVVLGDLDAR